VDQEREDLPGKRFKTAGISKIEQNDFCRFPYSLWSATLLAEKSDRNDG
jgi:hypothetical protein